MQCDDCILVLFYNQSSIFEENVLQGWLKFEFEILSEIVKTVICLISSSTLQDADIQ